ncbi:hypothetical protein NE236_09505 [Actinoallomurus purpureus]|uniref:hypothetical protein n=1 Tax=Actinoallomurus purpureus TaxID=478114 RepID=UPI002092C195|nr:hypothetical protein [Actinoallomurus purpureus]MCO6005220.1 hypothetical protein [Actinoallomurus purpureus]
MRRITLGILSASAVMCTLAAVPPAALAETNASGVSHARLDPAPLQFDHFTVSYDPWGNVTADGALRSDSAISSALPLTIEYSSDGQTGWTVKKTVTTDTGANAFHSTFFNNWSGYYRARFAGDATYQAATSPVRKAWRWRTEIHSFKVSPKKVRKNHYVTASGRLVRWFTNTKHGAYSGRKVEIIFRFKGKKTWYHLAWAKTNSKGNFTKKVKAYGKGYYAAVFRGGKGTFATGSSNTPYVKTYGIGGGSIAAQAAPGPVVNWTPSLPGPFVTGGSIAARRD